MKSQVAGDLPGAASTAVDAPLSPHWSFVVQFRALPGGQAYSTGRVEHLVSGRTAHFQSLEELTAYFARALDGETPDQP